MIIGRIFVFLLAAIIAAYAAFKETPELNEVENAWMYQLSYMMLIFRGLAYVAFDGFNLFPIE